jgi:hypothetical protein
MYKSKIHLLRFRKRNLYPILHLNKDNNMSETITAPQQEIISKLEHGVKFGVFNSHWLNGGTFYWETGEVIRSRVLSEAIMKWKNLTFGEMQGKSYNELVPELYKGRFPYAWEKHNWVTNNKKSFL